MKMNMTKKHFILLLGALAFVLIFAATPAARLFAAPGDQPDPLVAMSILDDRINGVNARIDQLSAIIQAMQNGRPTDYNTSTDGQPTGGAASYTPVSASAGQIILGGEGMEIILRSGSAAALCPGTNGLSDLTAGTDIPDGMALAQNHLLIVPRADGRGVKVLTDAWFLIKGGYSIY